MRLLLFSVDSIRGAAKVADVVEVVRAVAITPLPGAPAVVSGVIDVRGSLVPVFDLRRRFGRPVRPVDTADVFVIVRAGKRSAALHTDSVIDIVDIDERAVSDPRAQMAAGEFISGVAMMEDGLALINDVARFLSDSERQVLDDVLAASAGR